MKEYTWLLDIVKIGGPPVIVLLLIAVILLIRDNWRLQALIETMHDEKEAMYQQWIKDSSVSMERVTNALNNSTLAISTNSATTESLTGGLEAIKTGIMGVMALLGGKGLP